MQIKSNRKSGRSTSIPSTSPDAPVYSTDVEGKPDRSIRAASTGIKTTVDFTGLMAAMMRDLLDGSLPRGIATAVCSAGSRMLKAREMEEKYGTTGTQKTRKTMVLVD